MADFYEMSSIENELNSNQTKPDIIHSIDDQSLSSSSSSSSPTSSSIDEITIDTATIVSITSSCIILISGCIAVICLILYMKRTDHQNRYRFNRTHCSKCGANVSQLISREESSRNPINQTRSNSNESQIEVQKTRPLPLPLRQCMKNQNQRTNPYAISSDLAQNKTFSGIVSGNEYQLKNNFESNNLGMNSQLSQCSSNHEELIRAFELSENNCHLTKAFQLNENEEDFESFYRSLASDDRDDTPTDPGIREFTKSPPKPNERRQGVVSLFQQQLRQKEDSIEKSNSNSDESSTTNSTPTFNERRLDLALPRDRSRKPTWLFTMNQSTLKLGEFKEGLSTGSEEEGEEEEEEENTGSEDTNFKYFKVERQIREQRKNLSKSEINC